MPLLTVGHGPEDRDRLGVRLTAAGVGALLLAEADTVCVAVRCSESVWWRCHRRLVADVAVLGRGSPVSHLMPDGRLVPHRPSPGAVLGDGAAVWWPASEELPSAP